MSQSTSGSRGAMLIRQSMREVDLREALGEDVLALVERWRALPARDKADNSLFHRKGLVSFVIDRRGKSSREWPDEEANDLSESFFREFAERDLVWENTGREPRCFELAYKAYLEAGKIYQILCPVFDGDELSAFVVVAENHEHV